MTHFCQTSNQLNPLNPLNPVKVEMFKRAETLNCVETKHTDVVLRDRQVVTCWIIMSFLVSLLTSHFSFSEVFPVVHVYVCTSLREEEF